MPIIELQRRIVEAGRIRIGQQVDAGNGRTRPAKLEHFRLTSADRLRIDQAAAAFGGTVTEWTAPAGKQWQVFTTTDSLDVIVPPSDLSFTQNYELWSAGGCKRRCDGVTELLGDQACVCDPADRECDIHTRLSVMLRDLPGLGVWRLDTQGWYAASELNGAVQIIAMAAGRGALLPARLRLEQRSVKRPDDKGKPQTLRFAVPVLDIEISPAQLLAGGATPLQLADTGKPMTPVPALPGPGQSIAEQSEPPPPRPARKNAAPEIPASGRTRRTPIQQPEQHGTSESATPAASATQPEEESSGDAPPPVKPEAGGSPPAAEPPVDADDEPVAPDAPPRRPRGKKLDETLEGARAPDYWMKRVHAAGRERGLDHNALRLVAAAVLRIEEGDIDAFSSKDLVDLEFEMIDTVLRELPKDVDLDKVATFVWPRAEAKQLTSWEAIDQVVVAATGKQPDDLTVPEWIAFALRLANGQYDARQAASA